MRFMAMVIPIFGLWKVPLYVEVVLILMMNCLCCLH